MPAREPGQLLADKYRLIRLLGQGGMGSVWHAQHLMLNAPVALKFIESERLDAAAQQRFLGEARMAAALRSPHVVQILDYGVHEGTPHFAMELLEGESLAARLERVGRLDLAQTARVVQHVCRAITRAHDAGVIHRDLKPANVFIVRNDDDELLKVLDFGIAKGNPEALGQSAAAATRSGALLGTPQYMSPEQLDGAGAVDLRTDIWALGVLTYACLTGELPFAGDSVGRLVLAICSRPLPVPSERAAVPPGFDAWFARACARDREQRFGSARLAASEFAALARAASSPGHQRLEPLPGPAPAPPPAAPSPLGLDSTIQATQAEAPPAAAGRPPRWRRAAALVGVAALMLAVVGVARLAATSGSGAPPTTAPTAAAPAEATGTAPRAATASAARRRSVAMISLRNTAGRAADAWLGTALADLLRTELESGDQLRSVTRERVATLKRDLEFPETDSLERNLLTRIHDILDADMTLAGSYWRLGESDDLRMDVTLQDARSGETLASVAEHGPASNLFELVARAGERLRRKLGAESLSPAQLAQLQRSLPNDAEARGWYAEARERLDRTEYLAASELLGKVVEREPGFALGHALLSEAWAAIAYDTKAAAAAERARELSGDLPRKDQLLVEARAYLRNGKAPQAVGILRSLFTVFPDDSDFGLELGRAQLKADQLEDAEATLEELRKQPAGPSADPRIDLFEAGLAVALGDQARQLASAQRSFQRAEPLGMRTLQAEARYREADVLYLQGHAAEARDAYLDASRRYAALHDRGGEALALMQLGQVEGRTASDGESARAHLNTALKIFEEIGHQRNAGQVHIGLGGIYWAGGHLAQAEAEYRRALERFRSAQVQWGIATAQASIAAALGLQGELEAASQTFASLLELNRHLGNQRLEGNTLSNQGDLFLLLGRLRESRAAYEASIELQRKIGARTGVAYAQAGLAELLRLSGDAAAARALLESACPLARSSEEPDLLDSCSLLEMSLALDAGQPERVLAERSLWSQRFASSERPGSQATARSRLALALLAQGKLDEGRREASEARRLTEGSEEVRARAEALLADARVKAASGDREGAALSLRSLLQLAPRAGRPAKYEAELSLVEVLKAQRDPRWKKDARDLAERARQELFSLYAERAGKLLDAP